MDNLLNTPASDANLIKDSNTKLFKLDVIDASKSVPVIVDFWAPWCGPCKTLTPTLEKLVREGKGKIRLVKIDIDQNPEIATQMRVQSIPAVFAFVDGRPVDGFAGGASPCGAWDMAGNVWEWQNNLYQIAGDSKPSERLQTLDSRLVVGDMTVTNDWETSDRVALCGGSWFSLPEFARCSFRDRLSPDFWGGDIGFRVMLSLANLKTAT